MLWPYKQLAVTYNRLGTGTRSAVLIGLGQYVRPGVDPK